MENELLKFCLEKGILLDKETLNSLENFDISAAKDILEKISNLHERIITKSFITKNVEKIQDLFQDDKLVEKLRISLGINLEITKESYIKRELEIRKELEEKELDLGNVKIIFSHVNLTKKLEVKDFVNCFKDRYQETRRILQERRELEGLTSIGKISDKREGISLICMVSEKRVTKNKNILLEVEDITGRTRVLISNTKEELYNKAKDIIIDDIIAIKGFGNSEIVFANDIFYPDAIIEEKKKINRDENIAFISDIHVGSNNFLEKNFLKFIEWINGNLGNEKQREEAMKIKYLLVTGDTIDGVGIFPGQDELLTIQDISKQYEKLAEYLSKIRKDVKIIMCPGQHDSVRVAEPQPPIGRDYGYALYELDNVVLVSNPAIIEIKGEKGEKGIKILMYHGAGMTSFVNEIDSLRLARAHDYPTKVVREILRRRHLASIHSAVTYIPTEKDYLMIKEVPDIINTADFHKPEVDVYNNILIVCSSCWQSTTPFEEKVGNHPDPCKVPILNLKTRQVKILDFSDEVENESYK